MNNERLVGYLPKNELKVTQGDNYLLVIGINRYAHYMPLSNAVNDARDLEKVLRERYNFQNIKAYYDEDATQVTIRSALEWYGNNLKEEDKLIIFFSGHGYYERGFGYLVPVDAPEGSIAGFINNSTIKDAISLIAARHVLLILDSCFGGSFGRTRDVIQDAVTADKLDRKKSRRFMSSGSIEKVSDGLVGGNSPFTKSLLHGLRDNAQPQLIVSHLFRTVQSSTAWEVSQTPQYEIISGIEQEGGEMVLYLEDSFIIKKQVLTGDKLMEIVHKHINRREFEEAMAMLEDFCEENNNISMEIKNNLYSNMGKYTSALQELKFGIIGYSEYEKVCLDLSEELGHILINCLTSEDIENIDSVALNPKTDFVNKIEKMVFEKDIENALRLLVDYYKSHENFEENLITATLLQSQIQEIKDKVLEGKIEYKFYQQRFNRIAKNIHSFLDDILERDDKKRLFNMNSKIEYVFTEIAKNKVLDTIGLLWIYFKREEETKNKDSEKVLTLCHKLSSIESKFLENLISSENYFVQRSKVINDVLSIANVYAYSLYSFEELTE